MILLLPAEDGYPNNVAGSVQRKMVICRGCRFLCVLLFCRKEIAEIAKLIFVNLM